MDVFSPSANAFRFYDDDAGEATSTPLANQDTNITVNVDGGNVALQLRLRIQATTAVAGATTDDYAIQRSHNAGAYATVTTVTTAVIASTSGLTNNGATTDRATNGIANGTGSFVAGEQSTDGTVDDWQLTASNFSEIVYGLTVVAADVANGDTIDFRVSLNGGAPGMTNAVTPRITIQKAVVNSGALSGAGAGTATASGASRAAAALSGAGASTATASGAAISSGALIGLGAGVATAVGEGITISSGALSAAGSSTAQASSAAISEGALSADGVTTAQAVGAAVAAAALSADGASSAISEGEAVGGGGVEEPEPVPDTRVNEGAGGGSWGRPTHKRRKREKEERERLRIAAERAAQDNLDQDDILHMVGALVPLLSQGQHYDITVH